MTTLTEKRISGKLSPCSENACKLYEKAFPSIAADEHFWRDFDALDEDLGAQLAKRPISAMEIDQIIRSFLLRFRDLCREGRDRGRKQAGAATAQGG